MPTVNVDNLNDDDLRNRIRALGLSATNSDRQEMILFLMDNDPTTEYETDMIINLRKKLSALSVHQVCACLERYEVYADPETSSKQDLIEKMIGFVQQKQREEEEEIEDNDYENTVHPLDSSWRSLSKPELAEIEEYRLEFYINQKEENALINALNSLSLENLQVLAQKYDIQTYYSHTRNKKSSTNKANDKRGLINGLMSRIKELRAQNEENLKNKIKEQERQRTLKPEWFLVCKSVQYNGKEKPIDFMEYDEQEKTISSVSPSGTEQDEFYSCRSEDDSDIYENTYEAMLKHKHKKSVSATNLACTLEEQTEPSKRVKNTLQRKASTNDDKSSITAMNANEKENYLRIKLNDSPTFRLKQYLKNIDEDADIHSPRAVMVELLISKLLKINQRNWPF